MPNITVNTASPNLGLLPADLAQFPSWLNQYLPATQTVFQDESNVLSGFLALSDAATAYIANHGAASFNAIDATDLQQIEGPYTLTFHGLFSIGFSEASWISVTNTLTGEVATEYGNITFSGLPGQNDINANSTLNAVSDMLSNSVTPSSTSTGTVPMAVIWNGTTWAGNAIGYSESVSDPANGKSYEFSVTENPAPISFAGNSGTTAGSSSLAVPVIIGAGVSAQDLAGITTTDSLSVSGFSFSADTVVPSGVIPAALAGTDIVSISGAGALNVAGQLVNSSSSITGLTISDSAANVVANLDFLQILVAQGKLSAITLTDGGTPVLTVTPGEVSADGAALQAITSPRTLTVTAPTDPGVLGGLSANQQLEMVYIAYFNRSADGAGDTFWVGQNVQAQTEGQSAAAAVSNIANSFTPQAETIALYPFLGSTNLDLHTPTAQGGLVSFVGSVYQNLFGHAADQAGLTYWVGQITSGTIGLGTAALAIANGALASDAIVLKNKIAVATDFTTRATAAGLGVSGALPSTFRTAATGVLNGVDGNALNDASVAAGMTATTTYLAGASTNSVVTGTIDDGVDIGLIVAGGTALIAGATSSLAAGDTSVITVSGSDQLIDPGAGSHTIQFLAGASGDTLVLRADSMDQVSGFNPGVDALDVGALLSAANIDLNGDVAALSDYLTVVDQGANAVLTFDPSGHGGGSAIAVLQGLGSSVTSVASLIDRGAIRNA